MLAQYLDLAEQAIQNGRTVVIDISNYDYCLVQAIGCGASYLTTLDSGAIQGVSDGSAASADGFVTVYGKLNSSNNNVYNFSNTSSNREIIKFDVIGRYLQIICDDNPSKLLIMLAKIS